MFSGMCVYQSIHMTAHMTITHDAVDFIIQHPRATLYRNLVLSHPARGMFKLLSSKFLESTKLSIVPLIHLFWTSGDVCLGFNPLAYVRHCLHADSSDSHLVGHLLTLGYLFNLDLTVQPLPSLIHWPLSGTNGSQAGDWHFTGMLSCCLVCSSHENVKYNFTKNQEKLSHVVRWSQNQNQQVTFILIILNISSLVAQKGVTTYSSRVTVKVIL